MKTIKKREIKISLFFMVFTRWLLKLQISLGEEFLKTEVAFISKTNILYVAMENKVNKN